MRNFGIGVLVLLIAGAVFFGGIFVAGVGALNREAALHADIEAHERNREVSLDTMKKIITQKTQLPAAAKEDLLKLLPTVVSGRSGGAVFKSVQEQYPEFTLGLYKDISRSIEVERHNFQNEQAELFDRKREHDSLMRSIFGGTVCKMFGRREVSVKVISSTDAKDVVRTGVDDDVDLKLK